MGEAASRGLIDYIEVNYPIPWGAEPEALGIPVLAHTSSNPTCSAAGIRTNIARLIKDGADSADSPWIGEHLSWLGATPGGSLGYQINPLFTPEFARIAAENISRLRDYYGRPVALELGPIYVGATAYDSELHFLGDVAEMADTGIILDVTHWQIANKNLGRDSWFGLDALDPDRIVELHVAGMRQGSDGKFWHDAHDLPPPDEVISIARSLAKTLPALEAVTFEHFGAAPAEDFFGTLQILSHALNQPEPVCA